eukprot:gnl/MRDRNA2_/MRDRNA2_62919_c0_seq2.p1 gnl/MRDRNA2_/MRDRNA2_62919_c0~~gnl/MRDRNA2_/MRDRNA2_62919_c0_seq2.p1  ORF type:complete len:577 (-),score=103.84 gnl/MRDRNA2_/MRDRNA2_62919_c0_seq2:74-1804(-)
MRLSATSNEELRSGATQPTVSVTANGSTKSSEPGAQHSDLTNGDGRCSHENNTSSDSDSCESDSDSNDTSRGSDISCASDGKLSRSSCSSNDDGIVTKKSHIGTGVWCSQAMDTANGKARSSSSTSSGSSASSISSITGSSVKGAGSSASSNLNPAVGKMRKPIVDMPTVFGLSDPIWAWSSSTGAWYAGKVINVDCDGTIKVEREIDLQIQFFSTKHARRLLRPRAVDESVTHGNLRLPTLSSPGSTSLVNAMGQICDVQDQQSASSSVHSWPESKPARSGDTKQRSCVAKHLENNASGRAHAPVALEQVIRLGGRRVSDALPQVVSILETHGAEGQVAEECLAAIMRASSEPGSLSVQDHGTSTLLATINVIENPDASSKIFIRGVSIITRIICEECGKKQPISNAATKGIQAIVHGIRRWGARGDIQALVAGLDAATELASRSTLRSALIKAGLHFVAADAIRCASQCGDVDVACCGLRCLWNLRITVPPAQTELILSAVLTATKHLAPKSTAVTEGVAKVLWLLAATPEVCLHPLAVDCVQILKKFKTSLGDDGQDAVLSWVERSIVRISGA